MCAAMTLAMRPRASHSPVMQLFHRSFFDPKVWESGHLH